MGEKRTSVFENGLIWFGAGVSIAEIVTGTYFATLGFAFDRYYRFSVFHRFCVCADDCDSDC